MDTIRQLRLLSNQNAQTIIELIYRANAGHPGGSLSIIDILTAIYALDVDFKQENRSKVILSKGHAVPAQYAVLYACGIIAEEELSSLRRIDSRLQGHPSVSRLPEVDATTGLLGQGLSVAIGTALAKRGKGDGNRVYAIVGDGEMNEGQIWEALMQAPHFHLNNLIMIVDSNKLSSSGRLTDVMNIESIAEKLNAFHWNVLEIDGHDMSQIVPALQAAWGHKDSPTAIIANTIKGHGVSYMENEVKWHSSGLTDDQYKTAMEDLARAKEAI